MSEKLLPEEIQKKNNSADNKAADAETPLKKEEGKKKDIQSTNNKKKTIYGNPDDKYKDSSSNANQLQAPLEQIIQLEEKSHPSNSYGEEHNEQSEEKYDIIKINQEQKNENGESEPLYVKKYPIKQIYKDIVQEKAPKESNSNLEIINEEMSNVLRANTNQESTAISKDDKNGLQLEKKENIIIQPNNNFNKNKSRKIIRILFRKHAIQASDPIDYFNMVSMKDKNNVHINYKINFIKNNKVWPDYFLLNFIEINNYNEQQNISCSKKNIFGMDEHPNYDDNEGDNDIDKISQNDIQNCQNINANYGLYKKECEKGMGTVNDFNLDSISSSF